MKKRSVLFICNHNSARSIMAEVLLNRIYGDRYTALSAGVYPGEIQDHTLMVLEEEGLSIKDLRSKGMDEFQDLDIDIVVTVCDEAMEACPFFPGGTTRIHKSFRDPRVFSEEISRTMSSFREVRDDIRKWVEREFGDDSA